MKKLFFVMGMLLIVQVGQASELYRWVDKNGKVHYGDTPEEDAEKLKFSLPDSAEAASGVDETKLSYEARMARKNFPVTLYSAEKCEPCKQARDFLNKRHVPFTETLLKTQEDYDAFRQKSGSENIPALSIGRNWLKGFQSSQWQEELDAAGYPK